MSSMANTTLIVTTVTKTAAKEKTPNVAKAASRVNILGLCEEHSEDILSVMDKIHRDKQKKSIPDWTLEKTPGKVIEGKVHSNDIATLTRLARLSPGQKGNTLEMVHTAEVVLTNGNLLLAETVLEAKTAPTASKNRMVIPTPLIEQGTNKAITLIAQGGLVAGKEEKIVNPRYLACRRAAPAKEGTKTQSKKGDLKDLVNIFQATSQVERWEMPTWCHMFNSTLIETARVWFDELPPKSIDGYNDLKAAFLAYFMQQKKYVKDPVEIHNIKQKDRETIEDFMKRFKRSDMTGVPRSIAEHRLNIREGCTPVRQRKRRQDPKRAKAIQVEVQKLVEAGILREVYYHNLLSNLVMVKKHDGSWRMCMDFTDLNKACYHQIQMAEQNKEKTAFHTSHGVYCYTKMPFGPKNACATYQRLVDKAFDRQIVQNLEIYVDNLVIKSHTKTKLLRDIEETFWKLRRINMKLNPKKYKMKAVLQLSSPRTIKEVQSLNGKLASLNRFISKSAEKSLPLFNTLTKCIKKSDFQWMPDAKQAFKQLNQYLAKLPMLVAPKPKEELIMYLSASHGAISVVLMTEKDTVQTPVYFILPDVSYRGHHRPAHQASDITSRRSKAIAKMKLNAKGTQYHIPTAYICERADFLVEKPDDTPPEASVIKTPQEPWILFTDRSSCVDGSSKYEALIAGLWIVAQMGVRNVHEASKLRIKARQYELLEGVLYRWSFIKRWLRCIGPLQANYVIRKIHEGTCSIHVGPRFVVAKAMRLGYYWPTMHRDTQDMIQTCNACQVHRLVPRNPQQPLSPIMAPWPFYNQVKKFMWDNIVCCFNLLGEIVLDNVKHLQSNGLIERANQSLGKGIKARLGEGNKNWIEKLPHVLWAYHTMIKSSHAIREAKAKLKMTKYYNTRVRGVTFRPKDFVYRINEASHAMDRGKLGPKWEVPYEVTEALEDGAYMLRSMDRTFLLRMWNVVNLKKCYF
nr:hypothetical protein [Tanacetum cinerariifolium]